MNKHFRVVKMAESHRGRLDAADILKKIERNEDIDWSDYSDDDVNCIELTQDTGEYLLVMYNVS